MAHYAVKSKFWFGYCSLKAFPVPRLNLPPNIVKLIKSS